MLWLKKNIARDNLLSFNSASDKIALELHSANNKLREASRAAAIAEDAYLNAIAFDFDRTLSELDVAYNAAKIAHNKYLECDASANLYDRCREAINNYESCLRLYKHASAVRDDCKINLNAANDVLNAVKEAANNASAASDAAKSKVAHATIDANLAKAKYQNSSEMAGNAVVAYNQAKLSFSSAIFYLCLLPIAFVLDVVMLPVKGLTTLTSKVRDSIRDKFDSKPSEFKLKVSLEENTHPHKLTKSSSAEALLFIGKNLNPGCLREDGVPSSNEQTVKPRIRKTRVFNQ